MLKGLNLAYASGTHLRHHRYEALPGEEAGPGDGPKVHHVSLRPLPDALRPLAQASALALYTLVAIAMNFINKWTMQVYPLPNVVLILQMLSAVVVILPLLWLRVLDFPYFSWARCKQLLGITLLYTSNTALALFGLKTLNVPMYSTLKRLTPMLVLLSKVVWTRQLPPRDIIASVLLVVMGCVVAGLGDLSFDLVGYLFALSSCVLQAMYLVLVELQGAQGISTSEMLYYNSVSSLPFLLVIVWWLGEAPAALPTFTASVQSHGVASTLVAISLCATGGILLNFSMFLCTVLNTALTTTIAGVLRGVLIVLLGFFLLGGVRFSWLNVLGVTLNLCGGLWYSYLKVRHREPPLPKQVLATASITDLVGAGMAGKEQALLSPKGGPACV